MHLNSLMHRCNNALPQFPPPVANQVAVLHAHPALVTVVAGEVTAWAAHRSSTPVTMTAPNAGVTYAADSTNFNGRRVIQTTTTGGVKYLTSGLLAAQLTAASTKPAHWNVMRWRSVGVSQFALADIDSVAAATGYGNGAVKTTAASLASCWWFSHTERVGAAGPGTSPIRAYAYFDSSGVERFEQNGAAIASGGTGQTAPVKIQALQMGGDRNSGGSNISIGTRVLTSAELTALDQARLNAWSRLFWGI